MSDPLDMVHLRTVVAIADCGGFHRAAAALHLSQSTVSQHVRHLERVLGRPLVEKAGRATRFTAAGEALLGEARRILAVHDQALSRLSVSAGPTILVGCTEHVAAALLGSVVSVLSSRFPGRTVRVRVDRSNRLEEAVGRGALDLAVVLAGDQTSGATVGDLALAWYSAPALPLRAGELLPLVAFEEPCGLRRRALAALEGMGHTVAIAAESTSLEGVLSAARAGLGVALLPSVGAVPAGLTPRHDLPDLGAIGLCVTARRGLEPALPAVVAAAGRAFVATLPPARPQAVPA